MPHDCFHTLVLGHVPPEAAKLNFIHQVNRQSNRIILPRRWSKGRPKHLRGIPARVPTGCPEKGPSAKTIRVAHNCRNASQHIAI
eukprot:2233056-Amphidinium_carterae.1